jgi:hypothetical protein
MNIPTGKLVDFLTCPKTCRRAGYLWHPAAKLVSPLWDNENGSVGVHSQLTGI